MMCSSHPGIPDHLTTGFEDAFPRFLGEAEIHHDRTWNGERLFIHICWMGEGRKPMASVRVQFYPQRRQVWIGSLFVQQDFRGKGWGSKIVKAVETESDKAGVEMLRLFSRRQANGFWKKLGYKPEEDCRYLRKLLL